MSKLYETEEEQLPPYNATNTTLLKTSKPVRVPREYLFYRGNGLSSKATIRSSDGNINHSLTANISSSRPSTIDIHLGSSKTPALSSLVFPATHNDFQIHTCNPYATPTSPHPNSLIQVKARIGNPHPATYHFTLPATPSSPARKVVWTIRRASPFSSSRKHPTICYTLTDETTNEPLAFWTTVQGAKHSAILHWHIPPQDEREEFLVLASFIGCMTRLRLKGKEKYQELAANGAKRWGGMWFMAILGTGAVA